MAEESKKMVEETPIGEGAFVSSLKRNNRTIREDRAVMITEDAETMYRRKLEDIEMTIKQLKRQRDAELDLSPSDANSLQLAKDFKASDFVVKDLDITVELRQLNIKLEEGIERFEYLFPNKYRK